MKNTSNKTEAIGFDLGKTIIKGTPGEKVTHSGALRVIKRLITERFGDESYIVSKVDEVHKVRALDWLQREGFYELTGLPREHVEFCEERYEKAPICLRLGITHFIDDRPEVLSHMPFVKHRFLFQGDKADYETFKDKLGGVILVSSWEEIEKWFFSEESSVGK